jgi:beta-lactamase class A
MKINFQNREWVARGIFLTIGIFIGIFVSVFTPISSNKVSNVSIREHDNKYAFIAPLLTSADAGDQSSQYQSLKDKINSYINKNISKNDIVSVYFRDLNKGQWIGINEDIAYAPASLLKVVIMIAYFKKADNDPSMLNRYFKYESNIKSLIDNVEFETPSQLKIGESYSVNNLISRMIIDSDNGAKSLLLANIDDSFMNKVYSDLKLQGPDGKDIYTISVKSYSLFFRILYNSSYLSRELSDKALNLLSQTDFKDGLKSGVPNGTMVANKFGEHVIGSNSIISAVELHDCGIIYLPNNPYFLCVATHTSSFDKNKEIIKSLSSIVYADVNAKNR